MDAAESRRALPFAAGEDAVPARRRRTESRFDRPDLVSHRTRADRMPGWCIRPSVPCLNRRAGPSAPRGRRRGPRGRRGRRGIRWPRRLGDRNAGGHTGSRARPGSPNTTRTVRAIRCRRRRTGPSRPGLRGRASHPRLRRRGRPKRCPPLGSPGRDRSSCRKHTRCRAEPRVEPATEHRRCYP